MVRHSARYHVGSNNINAKKKVVVLIEESIC